MKFNLDTENINYVKITYKDNENFSHCVKSAIKQINDREIRTCVKTEEKIFIKTPQGVEMSFASDNGLYKTSATLKNVEWDEPYTFFIIQTPDDIEYEQNREYFRVKIEKDLVLTYFDGLESKRIYCKSYDLSANGIKIVMNEQISLPEVVTLDITLPKKHVITKAINIRSDNEDGIYKISFSFKDLSEQDKDYISQICIQKQLENKRQKL